MSNLSPPPLRDKHPVRKDQGDVTQIVGYATFSAPFQRWLSRVQELLSPVATGGLFPWSSVSKTGSNLTDIETRNHADLQNINTASYTHLTSVNHADLTDGNDTTLHYHATDRDLANATGQLDLSHLAAMKAYAARH